MQDACCFCVERPGNASGINSCGGGLDLPSPVGLAQWIADQADNGKVVGLILGWAT